MKKFIGIVNSIAVEWAKAFVQTHIVTEGNTIHVSEPDRVCDAMKFIAMHT